ncbi:MAG: hypothetical protein WDN69_10050 [Aliidongia sp.]
MEKRVSDEYSTIAFYGIEPKQDTLAAIYQHVLGWFEACGRSADVASLDGPGQSKKMGSFRRTESKLRKAGFAGVTGFSLISLLPNATIPSDDYALKVIVSLYGKFFIISVRRSIDNLSKSVLPFAISVLEDVGPKYGIGYFRESELGPTFYALGLSQGLGRSGREYLESLNISFGMKP